MAILLPWRKFKNICWDQKLKFDKKFKGVFEGFRNSAERFKDKILQEYSTNTADLRDFAKLEEKAEKLFDKGVSVKNFIKDIITDPVLLRDDYPILEKRIIGKQDVDIAAMIKKLGNNDWVKEGRKYYQKNDKVCPFCQQKTDETFEKNLEDYFDETFENDIKELQTFTNNYQIASESIQQKISTLLDNPSDFLNYEILSSEKSVLNSDI